MVAGFLQHGLERIELVGGERPWSRPAGVETHLRRRGGRGGRRSARKAPGRRRGSRAERSEGAVVARATAAPSKRETCDVSGPVCSRSLLREQLTGPRTASGNGDRGGSWTSTSCERGRNPGERDRRLSRAAEAAHIRDSSERTGLVFGPEPERGRCRRHETRRCIHDLDDRASERRAKRRHGRRAISDDRSRTRKKHREPTRTEWTERRPRTPGVPFARTGGRWTSSGANRDRAMPTDREVERHRRPPEADAARKSRGNLGRTAGGEQAAVMRTGCRRGQNLCRVRTVGTTHAIRINRSGETPEAARPWDDTGETGDGARSPPQGSSRRSRRSTRG